MTRWEYCSVGPLISDRKHGPWGHYAKLRFFKQTTTNPVELDNDITQIIAKLGSEGWEMVGSGNTSQGTHIVYFKRPLTE